MQGIFLSQIGGVVECELPFAVFGLEERRKPCIIGEITSYSIDVVACFEELVGYVTSYEAACACDEDS